jgi:RNA polymerase sigma-70 factor (ECF subfamily)
MVGDPDSAQPGTSDPGGLATGIIQEHGPALLRYLRVLLRDEATASDAFSLTIEWIWRGAASFRAESSVRTWVFAVAYNAARRLREDPWYWRRQTMQTSEATELAASFHTASAHRLEQQSEELVALRGELSADEQNLLALRVDQGLDWREIAEILTASGSKASEAAVRKRFERTKARIQKLARRRGLID